jgi:hypothetical protein
MSSPPCDRHKNLQMVPFGRTFIDVCPVPSCGRCHDDQGYFEVVDGHLVRGDRASPNKLFSPTERILKTLRARAGV